MNARQLHVDTMGGGEIVVRLPPEVLGWRAVGIAEVTQPGGAHQAFGLILQQPRCVRELGCSRPGAAGDCPVCLGAPGEPRRVALWWQRDPRRQWVLTPLSE